MQFKRVIPIADNPVTGKNPSYQNRTPSSIQKKHVKSFEASGLKQVKFCEQHNIPYKTFSNWLRRHRSDRVILPAPVDQATTMKTKAQEKYIAVESSSIGNITCSLPNGLSISISQMAIADLPTIIEKLSQCKLN